MENSGEKQLGVWWRLWTSPRRTIRQLIDHAPNVGIFWFAVINGIIAGLYWIGPLQSNNPNWPVAMLYAVCLIGGAIVGIIQLYGISWFYTFCGRWIGGKGRYRDVKCAVGWSFYPFIVAGLFGIFNALAMPLLWLQVIFSCLSTIAFIWGLVILFRIVSEAHQFRSSWRGVATVLIAILLVLGCLFLLSFLEALVL